MALAGLEEDPDPALDALETDYPQFDIPWGFSLSNLAPVLARTALSEPISALPDLIRIVTKIALRIPLGENRNVLFRSLIVRVRLLF